MISMRRRFAMRWRSATEGGVDLGEGTAAVVLIRWIDLRLLGLEASGLIKCNFGLWHGQRVWGAAFMVQKQNQTENQNPPQRTQRTQRKNAGKIRGGYLHRKVLRVLQSFFCFSVASVAPFAVEAFVSRFSVLTFELKFGLF